eukprot:SAG11_NODE_389_length_9870_cov_7.646812_3_plen_303_part_00
MTVTFYFLDRLKSVPFSPPSLVLGFKITLMTLQRMALVAAALELHAAACCSATGSRTIPLSGWELTGSDSGVRVLCPVPHLVHIDLHAAGRIGDPFDATEIDDARNRWVMDERNWTYTARFEIETAGAAARPALLVAQGLDTLATIRHNGVVVGHSTNMHLRVVILLHTVLGMNTLSFSFANPVPYAVEQQRQHPCACSGEQCTNSMNHTKPCKCCNFNATQYPIYSWAPGRIFVRKAQSHYGWNWYVSPRPSPCCVASRPSPCCEWLSTKSLSCSHLCLLYRFHLKLQLRWLVGGAAYAAC